MLKDNMYYLGIDVGSRNTKVAIIDANSRILFTCYSDTGIQARETISSLLDKAYAYTKLKPNDITFTYATGYGRKLCKADKVISEISCHTFGVQYYYPEVKTIIDIGGQDYKLIIMNEKNQISDFIMNDKCAAGTGRFLEMLALRLNVACSDLSKLAALSDKDIALTSTCVVFAESEIIGLNALGTKASDIARAVHLSISDKIIAQLNQLKWESPVVLTGGVALNDNIQHIISQKLNCSILTTLDPEITGALGACLIAKNDYEND